MCPAATQAQILGVSDATCKYTTSGKKAWGSDEASKWASSQGALAAEFRTKYGLEVRGWLGACWGLLYGTTLQMALQCCCGQSFLAPDARASQQQLVLNLPA